MISPTISSPGAAAVKIPDHKIGYAVLLPVGLGEADPPGPGLAGLQVQLTHLRPHQLRPGRHAPGHEIRVDPALPVRAVRIIDDFLTYSPSIPRLCVVADSTSELTSDPRHVARATLRRVPSWGGIAVRGGAAVRRGAAIVDPTGIFGR